MDLERNDKCVVDIPADIQKTINDEVEKNVSPLWKEDSWTAEQDAEFERDYKEAQYLLLDWLNNNYSFENILYAGSGSDFMPKIIFGEEKVFHTSMEEYKLGESKYFPDLGNGIKIVADNNNLPFPDGSFEGVLFFGLYTESTITQLLESRRVLKNNGLIVCDSTIIENVDLDQIFSDYERVCVPFEIQNRGISETNFAVFRKF